MGTDKIDEATGQSDNLRVQLENTRIALRNREEDVAKLRAGRAPLCVGSGLLGMMLTLAAGLAVVEIYGGPPVAEQVEKPLPTALYLTGAAHVERNSVVAGEPSARTRTDLWPLAVTDKDGRCFSIDWAGKVERETRCGYEIDIPELRKALCKW